MAIRATRGVADDNDPISQHPEADDPLLAVILARVFGLEVRGFKNELRVLEVQLPHGERSGTLQRIVGDDHPVSVSTSTVERNTGSLVMYDG